MSLSSPYFRVYKFQLGFSFSRVTTVETFGASSVASIEIDETMYLVVAQFEDNDGNVDVGTTVYSFNTGTGQI